MLFAFILLAIPATFAVALSMVWTASAIDRIASRFVKDDRRHLAE